MDSQHAALIDFLIAQLNKFHAEPGTLYVVGTPIGNLADLSPRAMAILATADLIAAEDTRHSGQLLRLMGLNKPLTSYHEHNIAQRTPELIECLAQGQSIALISDAGMPAISDPGEHLVAAARTAQIPLAVIPGPSAVIAALAASGLPTRDFRFMGFLPVKGKLRAEAIAQIRTAAPSTVVLYEAPHRLARTLSDLADAGLSDTRAVVMRELTKQHETYHRGTVAELLAYFSTEIARGELVLLLTPTTQSQTSPDGSIPDTDTYWNTLIDEALAQGQRPKEVVKLLQDITPPVGIPPLTRNECYARVQSRRAE